ncbi:type VI secretion lipoprotein TssJ [Paenalcaligenes faecalis]|uniref:type VI secretion lipoprotein TssJ n=1 Tax=Paenalcaligenes faecalis TaxID=2980099 RepID=UPI0022B9B155|nr:type VI secretion lipoprotein TssJ [Paenalcaligenes faecalis]
MNMARKIGNYLRPMLAFALCMSLIGCGMFKTQSKEEALEKMQWEYGDNAIHLQLDAGPDLNWWGDQPHTLLLVVVQMDDLSAMEAYRSSAKAMSDLLLAETAPSGLLTLKRFFIEPGVKRDLQLARVDQSRYVGVVLGYQHLDPKRSIRLYQIGADMDRKGWVFRQYQAKPEPLKIELRLGAEGVEASHSERQPIKPVIQPKSGLIETAISE